MNSNHTTLSGIYYGILATVLWGSYPLWYKPLKEVGAVALLEWRIVWSIGFLLVLIIFLKRKSFLDSIGNILWKNIATMSFILALWWLTYIYGILTDRILEIALGYFISPIMSLFVSQFIFKEKINTLQKISVLLATISVLIMVFYSLEDNYFPWIALTIGFCFSFYGVFKKKVTGDPIIIQTFEMLLLLPFAIIGMLYFTDMPTMDWGNYNQTLLLIATGVISVLPLWWYSIAASNLTVFTLSFLQFIPPTINFLLAIFVYNEELPFIKIVVFSLIWIAIAVLLMNTIKQNRS